MTITTIILAHYKEREGNLKRIVDDLLSGSLKPEEIIIFIDNPEINFIDDRVIIIRSTINFLPIIRFAIGSICDTDYCFFIDDDLSVQKDTLLYLANSSIRDGVIGFEGSILGKTDTPYSNDNPVRKPDGVKIVDIVIRTYFVPTNILNYGLKLRADHPELPKKSLDDVFLCLGNKYLNRGSNYIIPTSEGTGLIELPDYGVGQSYSEDHYKNRNEVCRRLMDIYE